MRLPGTYISPAETGFYYLQSRYYDPAICRFINSDSKINIDKLFGNNLFAYCDNNPINKIDYTGEDGKYIELGKGWYSRVDPQDTTTGTQRHIHIWNDKKGISYAQNDDGSPHDKNNNSKGKLPKWLQEAVSEKTGWDYNKKRKSFFSKTVCSCEIEGTSYTFADGTAVFRQNLPYKITADSIDSLESIYFNDQKVAGGSINYKHGYYFPIFGPKMPSPFSFGFGWGWSLFPLFA